MRKKLVFIVLSALITLFFLFMAIYELGAAFITGETGSIFTASQIVGWISFFFFVLSALCLLLTVREPSASS